MSEVNYNAGWKGYVLRDYASDPEFSSFQCFSAPLIPRSEWVERIDELNAAEASCEHAWRHNNLKPFNQKSTNYCWQYSLGTAMRVTLAQQGIDPMPKLNPFATACQGKRGANRGGYSTEAARYVQKYGMCETTVWPEFEWSYRTYQNKPEVKASANMHMLVDFEEMPREGIFDYTMSALIQGFSLSVCYSWWRHAVSAMKPVYKGSKSNPTFGLRYMNSWGNWGSKKDGFGTVYGQKAAPFEAVVVRSVKARSES